MTKSQFAILKANNYVMALRSLGLTPTKEGYLFTLKMWKNCDE